MRVCVYDSKRERNGEREEEMKGLAIVVRIILKTNMASSTSRSPLANYIKPHEKLSTPVH